MLSPWTKVILLLCYVYFTYGKSLYESGLVPVTRIGNKAYYIGDHIKLNFFYAMDLCDMLGMRLISITSKEFNDLLGKMLRDANKRFLFWTSGIKWFTDKQWIWLAVGKPVTYTRWVLKYPHNQYYRRGCISADSKFSNLLWYSSNCYQLRVGVLCESPNDGDHISSMPSDNEDILNQQEVTPNIPSFSYNKSSYYFAQKGSLTFFGASRFCNRLGMDLLKIETPQENSFIYKIIKDVGRPQIYWTGGIKLMPYSNWYWFPSGNKVIYTSWARGQPDKKDDFCINVNFYPDRGLFWHDSDCTVSLPYICETATENIAICPNSEPNYKKRINVGPESANPISKYHIGKEYVTHAQAVKKCEDLGLKLVSVQNIDKQEVLSEAIENSCFNTDSFWTSGHRVADEKWIWLSGEVISEFYWKHEPTVFTDIEECLSIMKIEGDYYWYSEPCSYEYYYICEPKK